jgi:cytochrome P450
MLPQRPVTTSDTDQKPQTTVATTRATGSASRTSSHRNICNMLTNTAYSVSSSVYSLGSAIYNYGSYLVNYSNTAHIPGVPLRTLLKPRGLGIAMAQAEAAASQHPNQITTFYIGPFPAAYVRQQEHVAALYHHMHPSSHPIPKNGDKSGIYPYLFGHSILNMLNTDPEYKDERIFYTSALMDKSRLANSADIMNAAMLTHLKNYPPENITNVYELRKFVNRLIITMVAETQLGIVDLTEAEKDKLADLVSIILPEISNIKLIAYLKLEEFIGKRPEVELDKVLREGYAFLQTLIDRNRKNILKEAKDPKYELFLRRFLCKIAKEKDISLEAALAEECRRFAALVLFAGYESTSTSTFFTAMLLADPQHQEIVGHMRHEIAAHWDGVEPLTKAHLDKMKYVRQALEAAQRLYPPFPTFKDVVNEDIMLGDVLLKKGTILLISPLYTHRIPNATNLKDPEKFIPTPGLHPKNPNYQFFTFGPEPTRTCPGLEVATLENQIAMVHLVTHFDTHLATMQHPFDVEQEYSLQMARHVKQQEEKIAFTRRDKSNNLRVNMSNSDNIHQDVDQESKSESRLSYSPH